MDEQKPLFPETEDLSASRPRRTAGRIPRKPYPIVVPNLTKKARGRQVPTKDMLLQSGSGRVFACQVESCRKVFTRSEHLKRHTRSIHTHEKQRVRPSPQHSDPSRDGSIPLSPTMGVLLPPSPQTATLTYSQLPMNDIEGASAYEAAASPASCDESSECTPGPSETTYSQYDRAYAWHPEVADVYTTPQYEYAAPQYQAPQRIIAPTGMPLGIYGYQS
ncbi:hypothetical protein EIP86_007359 [Pleurotus ostreatoroseus]|nr:hypothetical protein EIP86_007359 [Pleurotus ostreatoroseus]